MTVETEAIWREMQNRLRAFIFRRVANPADVDDILQETFMRIHRGIGSLHDSQRLSAWVFQIARNTVIDHFRSRNRHELPNPDARVVVPAKREAEVSEPAEVQSMAGCVTPMIDALEPKYRDALLLTEWEGLTHEDAAVRAGVSVSGMKTRVQRARQKLKDMLVLCCRIELDRRGGIIHYQPHSENCRCGSDSGCS